MTHPPSLAPHKPTRDLHRPRRRGAPVPERRLSALGSARVAHRGRPAPAQKQRRSPRRCRRCRGFRGRFGFNDGLVFCNGFGGFGFGDGFSGFIAGRAAQTRTRLPPPGRLDRPSQGSGRASGSDAARVPGPSRPRAVGRVARVWRGFEFLKSRFESRHRRLTRTEPPQTVDAH